MRRGMSIGMSVVLIVGMLMSAMPVADVDAEVEPISASALTPHAPIRIDGNADFTVANGVSAGDGSAGNPWIIENWDIDGTGAGAGIYVGNTTEHFEIRNCTLYNASGTYSDPFYSNSSVIFYNVTNGTVDNITAYDIWGNTINIFASEYVTVMNSNLTGYIINGVVLLQNSNYSIIKNNYVNDSSYGIRLYKSKNNTVYNNTILNSWNGIRVGSLSNDNDIFSNNITLTVANPFQGIYLIWSENNTLWNNSVWNYQFPISVTFAKNSVIYHNNFINYTDEPYDDANVTWDNGYPSGGNYWDDYSDNDSYKGMNQDVWGSDGIWDSNYSISGGSAFDNYPLTMPYKQYLAAEFVPPYAIDQSPNATVISIYTDFTISWNETMNWTSVMGAFNFTNNSTAWNSTNGTWMHNSTTNVSTFTPGFNLTYNTTYWLSVNVTATDVVGNALDQDQNGTGGYWPEDVLTWNFTTMPVPESIPPFALNHTPIDNAANVSITTAINVTWNETMDWESVNASFSYTNGTAVLTSANGTWVHNSTTNTSVFTPTELLIYGTNYTVTINKTATDIVGNPINQTNSSDGSLAWNFTTIDAPPTVLDTSPFDGEPGVNPQTTIWMQFNEAMNTTSVETAFSYTNGSYNFTAGNGSFSWNGALTEVTFSPFEVLQNITMYDVTLDASLANDTNGNNLDGDSDSIPGGNYTWNFLTWDDPPPPTIKYVRPTHNTTLVNVNQVIQIAFNISGFNNTMDTATVEDAFSITDGNNFLNGDDGVFSWTVDKKIMSYKPNDFLYYETNYTVRLEGTAGSIHGIGLDTNENGLSEGTPADDLVFSFMTSKKPPVVLETYPENAATGVSIDIQEINITFDRSMNAGSVNNAVTVAPNFGNAKTWSSNNTILTISPSVNLSFETNYSITIDGNTATDLDGVWLDGNEDGAYGDDFQFRFSTVDAPDITPPSIVDVRPQENATNVEVTQIIGIKFNEPMNKTSVEEAFTLENSTAVINGSLNWNLAGTEFFFAPDTNLSYNTTYTATLDVGAMDIAGNHLNATFSWSFTTGEKPAEEGGGYFWYFVAIIFILLIVIAFLYVQNKQLKKKLRRSKVKYRKLKQAVVAGTPITIIPDVGEGAELIPNPEKRGLYEAEVHEKPVKFEKIAVAAPEETETPEKLDEPVEDSSDTEKTVSENNGPAEEQPKPKKKKKLKKKKIREIIEPGEGE